MKNIVTYISILLMLLFIPLATACSNPAEIESPQSSTELEGIETSSEIEGPHSSSELESIEISPELEGTQWSLVKIGEQALIEGSHITIRFDDNFVRGSAGCNDYWGEYYTKHPNMLEMQVPGRTEMLCIEHEGVNSQENAYLSTLPDAAFYKVINDSLEIYDKDNEKLLVFEKKPEFLMNPANLIGTRWQLVSMNDKPCPRGSFNIPRF